MKPSTILLLVVGLLSGVNASEQYIGGAQTGGPSLILQHSLKYNQMRSDDWTVKNVGAGKLTVENLPDGTMKVQYNGGDGEAILSSKLPVYGEKDKNHIRADGQYRIISDEYGSLLWISINGTVEPRIMSMSGDKPFPPGFQAKPIKDWAWFDFPVAAKPMIPYHLRFTFRGNPMTVIFNKCTIYTDQIVRQGRPPVNPEQRTYDRAAVEQSLSKIPAVKAELLTKTNHVDLSLDGKIIYPAIYRRGPHYPFWSRYADFRDAGVNLYTFYAFMGKASETHKMNVGNLWLGKDKYDFSKVAEELRVIHAINPNARVLLTVSADPYEGWEKDYPEAVFTNANGEVGYGATTCKKLFYGKDREPARTARLNEEWYAAPSLYGEEFRTEAAKSMEALSKFLNEDLAGKIVFGIHVVGGADGQFFPFDRDVTSGEDHSPSAQRAWRKFLVEKYQKNLELLRKAWKNPSATFESPGIPDISERGADNSGIQPTMRGRDYTLFIADVLAEFRLSIFKAIKSGSNRRLLTGAYCPPGTVGNFFFDKILASPDTDFLIDILRYSPAGSYIFHGKLHFTEQDLRNYDLMKPIDNFTFDRAHFESITRQASTQACQRLAGGYHLLDLSEAYYSDPKISQFFGKVNSELASALNSDLPLKVDVGVIMDYRHVVGQAYRNESKLQTVINQETCYALEHSGVPFQIFQIGDIFNERFNLPKILIFPLTPDLTTEQLLALRQKAAAAQTTIVWGFYKPFYHTDATSIHGYELSYPSKMENRQLRAAKSTLTIGMENKILGRTYSAYNVNGFFRWTGIPAVIKTQPDDQVLAVYQPEQLTGMILRKVDGVTEIMNGAPGAFSPQFFRNVAAKNGIDTLSSNDSLVVMAENGILSVLCERGGPNLKVKVPSGLKVVSSPTGHHYRFMAPELIFDAPNDGDMAYFKLEKAEK